MEDGPGVAAMLLAELSRKYSKLVVPNPDAAAAKLVGGGLASSPPPPCMGVVPRIVEQGRRVH